MTTKECIVHIGMNKTGTTSIQETLYQNSSLQGAHYVDLGGSNAGRKLYFALLDDPQSTPEARRKRMTLEEAEAVRRAAHDDLGQQLALPSQRFILSGELLSNLQPAGVARLRDLLTQHGCAPQIVAYVRSARGMMESGLQQNAKIGMQILEWDRLFPKYERRLAPHVEVFGASQVKLWHFSPETFPERCVVRDFCQRTALTVDPATIQRNNESLPRAAVAMLVLFWRHTEGMSDIVGSRAARHIAHIVRNLPETLTKEKCRLSPEKLTKVFKRHRPQLDWAEDRLGVSLSDVGESHPNDIHTTAELLKLSPEAVDWLERSLGRTLGENPGPVVLGKALYTLAQQPPKRPA